jgi:gluconokinase
MTDKKVPVSAYVETQGMRYFARSLSKIRYFAAGELREDFHENLGKAMDAFLCDYLRVDYSALRERTLGGGSDEEILTWAQEQGRDLSAIDIRIWNHFITKLGWNDDMTHRFLFRKEEAGLMARADIQTIVDVLEADEGRA